MMTAEESVSPELIDIESIKPVHSISPDDNFVFEADSDVERLVEEVLLGRPTSMNHASAQVENVTLSFEDNAIIVDDDDSFQSDGSEMLDVDEDQVMQDQEGTHDAHDGEEEEFYVDPFDLLQSMGVKAFIEEQRSFEMDPREIYEAFELDVPEAVIGQEADDEALWVVLEDALEEVYWSLLCSSSSGEDDMAVELSLTEVEADDNDNEGGSDSGSGNGESFSSSPSNSSSSSTCEEELSAERQERLARANAYLVDLRKKGPLKFAEDQETVGTSAEAFLADIGFRLPRSLQYVDHKDQWAFIRRFLIKHVYQRPRNEHLNSLEHAVECIRSAKRILVVTGAGISVSCGIPDFRSEHGLYAGIREKYALPEPECMFDIEYFRDDPAPFYMLAKELFPGQYKPSPTHYFIKELEGHNKLLCNFTQNIDTLEQVAGIEKAVYCHGSFASATCIGCKSKYSVDQLKGMMEANPPSGIPYCEECEEGVVKPDIVFFGEPLPSEFDHALEAAVEVADLVMVIGSSMKVQPVSMIPDLICPDVPQILINRERLDHYFDIELIGDADVILGEIARRLGIASLGPHQVPSIAPNTEFVAQNVTLFSGCQLGSRPPIPEPTEDGSILSEAALSPSVQQTDPLIDSLVHQIFPKPV